MSIEYLLKRKLELVHFPNIPDRYLVYKGGKHGKYWNAGIVGYHGYSPHYFWGWETPSDW
jgi:hypothetical protein